MFTDISAAIEEARWLRKSNKCNYSVVQSDGGVMNVRVGRFLSEALSKKVMYSTKSDRNGTVLPEVR